jgi:hypothetical protein
MPAGMQIFDASGNRQLEISDRVFRLLTIAQVGTTTTGSISAPGLDTGTPMIQVITATGTRKAPNFTISGSNVNWDYGSIPSGERDNNLNISVAVF